MGDEFRCDANAQNAHVGQERYDVRPVITTATGWPRPSKTAGTTPAQWRVRMRKLIRNTHDSLRSLYREHCVVGVLGKDFRFQPSAPAQPGARGTLVA